MIKANEILSVTMEEITDPVELAKARARREQSDRNWNWLKAHPEVYDANRGKVICIAGQEVFAAEAAEEAVALAKAAHPEDKGSFTLYIPKEKLLRIYANQRRMD